VLIRLNDVFYHLFLFTSPPQPLSRHGIRRGERGEGIKGEVNYSVLCNVPAIFVLYNLWYMKNIQFPERSLCIAIFACGGIASRTFRKISSFLKQYSFTLAEFWQNTGLQEMVGLQQRQIANIKKFKSQFTPQSFLENLADKKIEVILSVDKNYPKLLKHIDDKPLILFKKGADFDLNKLPIAVVGTRRATGYGRMVTEKIVAELVREQATIVSGFMYGIDSIAHRAALTAGGKTVGILGFGFDHMYPQRQNKFFADMLAQGGMFLTEFPPQTRPQPGNFPLRNRIVAGMCRAVIVAEAAAESGSLITANLALDYGREVFAIPGPITSPYSDGTKSLLKAGANFASCGQDIMQELGYADWIISKNREPEFSDALEKQIWQQLNTQSMNIDDLNTLLKVDLSELSAKLSLMEIRGLLRREGENWLTIV